MDSAADPSAPQPRHVFISYARDGGAGQRWAERIETRLRDAGIPCWRDVTGVEPDQAWSRRIPENIDRAAVLVCVISRSVTERDWVDRELVYALGHEKPIIPARVDTDATVPFNIYNQPPLEFATDEADAWAHLERRCKELLGLTGAPGRQGETAYLHRLLGEQQLNQIERLYTPLSGERRERRQTLARVLPQALIPVTMRLDRQADDVSDSKAKGRSEHFEDALQALTASKRLVVLGEPGAGKTFSLWRLAAKLARDALDDPTAPLPVLVPLGEWIDPDQTLEAFARYRLGDLAGSFDNLRANRRLALLLDGLNELPTAQRKAKGAQIRALADDRRLPLLAASCRERDYVGDLRLDLDSLIIQPLDPPRVHGFVTRYMKAVDPSRGEESAEELFWHLAGGGGVHNAWRTWQNAGLDTSVFWMATEPPRKRRPAFFSFPRSAWECSPHRSAVMRRKAPLQGTETTTNSFC